MAGNAVDLVKDLAGLDGRQRLADGAVGWAERLRPRGIIDFANAYQE